MKKVTAAITASLMTGLSCMMTVADVHAASNTEIKNQFAGTPPDSICCLTDDGTNINYHNYKLWANPVYSNLVPLGGGNWMRVQSFHYRFNQVTVEYYDSEFNLTDRIIVPKMLPSYGGFHLGSDGYYYLITGDELSYEQFGTDPKFDIAKYDRQWHLIGHVQTPGVDVKSSLEEGGFDCADDGHRLILTTSRYIQSGHQVSYSIEVNMEDMTIQYEGDSRNFVSHCFNNFVLFDGDDVVYLAQGDGNPRCVQLTRYPAAGSKTNLSLIEYGPTKDANLNDMAILNYTGVSVGSLVQSDTHYLVAYNEIRPENWYDLAVNQEFDWSETARNIRIAAVPKDNLSKDSIEYFSFTDFPDDAPTCRTPYLVPVKENRFALIWSQDNKVYWVLVNGRGEAVSEQHSMEGALSDCEPVVYDNHLYWYTWYYADLDFYSVNLENPIDYTVTHRIAGHECETTEPDEDGNVYEICTKCGQKTLVQQRQEFILGIQKVNQTSDRIELTPLNYETDYLDAGDVFTYYTDKDIVNTTHTGYTFLTNIDYVSSRDTSNYLFFKIHDFDDPSLSFTIRVWSNKSNTRDSYITFKAKHDYVLEQINEAESIITLRCSGCGHTAVFAADSLKTPAGETVQAALAEEGGETPAVIITVPDPETGEPVVLEEDTDFSVAYVKDPDSDTVYTVIVAAPDSTNLVGSKVIPFQKTAQPHDDPPQRVPGDVNADGACNEADAKLLCKWLCTEPETALADWEAGDMNADGKLNAVDLTFLLRALHTEEPRTR